MTIKKWAFQFSEKAREAFLDFPKSDRIRIETKLAAIFESNAPLSHFKSLSGNLKAFHSLRIGEYRFICQINGKEFMIIAVTVGHRKHVYKMNTSLH